MEESEKRKERLKAMRIEAAQIGVYTGSENPGAPGALTNPLIESETTSAPPLQYTAPRFDYYTDPMSAFSGNKRSNNISPQVSQGHYNTPPRPMHQSTITNPAYQYPAVNSPGPGIFHVPRAHFNQSPIRSPMGASSPLNRPQQNPPSAWAGSGGAFNYNTPSNMSRGGPFTSPGFRQGASPYVNYGQGRGCLGQQSGPQYDSGRGRGRGQSFGSGPSFRRGSGSRDSVSADQRPDLYYSKEMVEDPWWSLSPVMWKGVDASDSNKCWLPKSIAIKKSKVSPETSQPSMSQQSLAEYLAASFNDSINEDGDNDEEGE